MKFIANVTKKRFDEFAATCPLNHYSKVSNYADFIHSTYPQVQYCGVENDQGELIATALLLSRKSFHFLKYSYCPYGMNLFNLDESLIAFMIDHLVALAKKNGSIFLRIDPNILRREHSKNGSLVDNGFNHENITELLIQHGFIHLGYNGGYSGNWMSRFTIKLDMHDKTLKQVLKDIKRCNTLTNKNEMRDIRVYKAAYNELYILQQAQKELSEKLGFKVKPLTYFERLWKCYEKYVHYYVVDVNYHQAIINLQTAIEELQDKLEIVKDQNKIQSYQSAISSYKKEIKEIKDAGLDQDIRTPLGGKFIIQIGENVWNINMYTNKSFVNFRAAFALHRYVIEDRYLAGAKTYDFEGIVGTDDSNDPYFGQQEFKKSFGGDYLEFLGEFDQINHLHLYQLWKLLDKLYRRIRRKFYSLMYRKNK